MKFFNPLPSSLRAECGKCAGILTSFIEPHQPFGADKVIPSWVLSQAQGLAVLSVVKVGFVGSLRFGSGLIVARTADGDWSAPSAIMLAGGGVGGQIGFELTEFVFVLNDKNAVKTFAQAGSLAFSANVSFAAGPIGRNAEAAGAASLKSVAPVFSYANTQGVFAGVSIEGTGFAERKEANEKFYGRPCRAKELLEGTFEMPPDTIDAYSALHAVLQSRPLNSTRHSTVSSSVHNNNNYSQNQDNLNSPSPHINYNAGLSQNIDSSQFTAPPAYSGSPYTGSNGFESNHNGGGVAAMSDQKRPPPQPDAATMKKIEAVALWSFDGNETGDLRFKKGDTITVTKKTDSDNDWWTGTIGNREGIFPSNYVKVKG